MSYLVDTDICSAHLKQRGPVMNRFLQHMGRLHVSVITVGELTTWALRGNAPARRAPAVKKLLSDLTILDATDEVGREFGRLRAEQLDVGRPTPVMDLWIAATARLHGLTVVTHNVKDFAHVPGLTVEDWLVP